LLPAKKPTGISIAKTWPPSCARPGFRQLGFPSGIGREPILAEAIINMVADFAVEFNSCGSSHPIIPTLIDLGVDIPDPVPTSGGQAPVVSIPGDPQ